LILVRQLGPSYFKY